MLKRKIKKILAIMISITMMSVSFIPNVVAKAYVYDVDFLRNQGYSEDFIGNLNEKVAEKMIETIGEDYVAQIDTVSFTLDEQGILMRGAINPSNLVLELTASAICKSGSTKIESVLVVATWEWSPNKPLYRGEDAISINWDSTKFNDEGDSFYSVDLYKGSADADWETFKEWTTTSESNQGGLGYHTNLKSFVNIVGGQTMFVLTPDPDIGMRKGTTYSSNININYVHQKSAFSGISFSVADFGVGIEYNNCDTMADTYTFRYSK